MKKISILLYLSLFILFSNCGYQPIYSKNSGNFNIGNIEIKKTNNLNYKIKNDLKVFSNSNFKKKYDLEIDGKQIIDIVSKDSKGNPKIYKMTVKINTKIIKNFKVLKQISFQESFNYNNNSNKFKLKQYEKNIRNNLVEKNIENITFYISNIE